MFRTPDCYHNISMRLSEVLEDIGVNEKMVLNRRRASLLNETMSTVIYRATDTPLTEYNLGSRSEGTTTLGLRSDSDMLGCEDRFNVIQDWSDWTPGKNNLLMIQNETTPPGYCRLQILRSDAPLPGIIEKGNHFVKDTCGRVLYKNSIIEMAIPKGRRREGPALVTSGETCIPDDAVIAHPCKSWSPRAWLDRQETITWPTEEMKRYAKTTKCFVVAVGSRVSENSDYEWRLSTSLAERCLMFNLNITQIRCYILMKMILKTYINLDNESFISSFMCKTVLLHCIASKQSHIWKKCNILNCLTYCISTLNRCIVGGNCPHFIDNKNNLMAGKITAENKRQLIERTSNLIPLDVITLSGIWIDDLGERLQIKLNMTEEVHHNIRHPDVYTRIISTYSLRDIATVILVNHMLPMLKNQNDCLEMKLTTLLHIVKHLIRFYKDGDMLGKAACRLLAPLYCTSIGSLLASHYIQINRTVSPQALAWLEAGLDSDVASSRLKLASIMYCVGNVERAALVLNYIEENYEIEVTEPVCGCYRILAPYMKKGFGQISSQYDVQAVKCIVAFCVRIFPGEINCVPQELQYEMFKSTQEDLLHRGIFDHWMDWAVVDSLPYLYFLQYKTYGNLQRPEEQQQALSKLVHATETEINLRHRETALNLLGQCMEHENRTADALNCYMLSLRLRERNNVAKIHICRCLAKTIS